MIRNIQNKLIRSILEGAIEVLIGTFISNYYAIIASIGYRKLISTYDVIQKLRNQGDEHCVFTVQMVEVVGIAIIVYGIISIVKQIYNCIYRKLVINGSNEVNICNYKNLNK